MNRMKFILLIIVGLILLVGCEEGASIKIINRTNYNVYAEVDGEEFTVTGNSSYKVNVDTDEKIFLIDDGVTYKNLQLVGETFLIWDNYDNMIYNQTDVKVTPGKTYNVYCTPNKASVKVINNSDHKITELKYRINKQFSTSEWFVISYDPPLERGDFAYYHLLYQTEENRFFYNFTVEADGEVIYSIGDQFQGVELSLDEQHLIVIEDDIIE